MDETFDLPVFYNNEEILLPAQLHQYGYTYKIEVEVNGRSIFFERDEERNWRAIAENNTSVNFELLQAISISLQEAFE